MPARTSRSWRGIYFRRSRRVPPASPNPGLGVVFCGVGIIFPNFQGFLCWGFILVFFFLICTWILTFYGLKSTDSNRVCSTFVGSYGCATREGEQALVDPPNESILGHFYTNPELLRLGEILCIQDGLLQGKPRSQASKLNLASHVFHLQPGAMGGGGFCHKNSWKSHGK